MELGARSLDILIALLSRPNEAISKRDLARCGPMLSRKKAVCDFKSPNCVRVYGRIKTSSRSDSTFAALRSRANCQPFDSAYQGLAFARECEIWCKRNAPAATAAEAENKSRQTT
jgi:hypothetical protein